ncbi:bifunctional UDP-N-acetylglucosamine diphosphorylase/glucosamine-1-phosphate N-acetyltransferase GlmU [Roseiterribacter gracilis]|uniref:Bifunctional protein GlmU n=1 Tax=Roseiterribacter gracilis TaxID=2812848 RepID=A0A8S8XCC1_9PROT|nr:bifunctional protein GlmU [Rhodospirillales bacterium TMPK1]
MTNQRPLAAIVLAAGKGTRMKSDLPKVMHAIGGRSMVRHVLEAAVSLGAERTVVVVGPGMEMLTHHVAPVPTTIQTEQRGTADAVRAAMPALAGFTGDVLVLYGDVPLVRAESLAKLRAARTDGVGIVVFGMRAPTPNAYGRLVQAADGTLDRIVEFLDANDEERALPLCNSGILLADGARLGDWLARVKNDNAKSEFYLTDIVGLARQDGLKVAVVEGSNDEVAGVNSRAELAVAEETFQRFMRESAMADGVTLTDPGSVWFSANTKLGRDVIVHPHVVFGPDVTVGDKVEIKSFSHLEGCTVERGAIIGPFARLRPGAQVGEDAHVGNFVELKNTVLGKGAKANHLTYLGDATVGAGSNIGAGTITCNYDGFGKYKTEIGAGAFIGSNSSLVAPVKIGNGAYVGSSSVITRDVPDDALAIGRGRQSNKEGWAASFRERMAHLVKKKG